MKELKWKFIEINLYKHMVSLVFFKRLYFEFAWWAKGDPFTIFDFKIFCFDYDFITFVFVQIGKASIDIGWELDPTWKDK